QVDAKVGTGGGPGGPDLHLHGGAAVFQAGEALGHDTCDGASFGHEGRLMVPERLREPGPSDRAEQRVVGQLRLELGAGEGDDAPYPVPGLGRGRVVQEDETAGSELDTLLAGSGGDLCTQGYGMGGNP